MGWEEAADIDSSNLGLALWHEETQQGALKLIDYTCDHSSKIASFLFNHALCSCSLQGYDCHQHLHHCLVANDALIGLLCFFRWSSGLLYRCVSFRPNCITFGCRSLVFCCRCSCVLRAEKSKVSLFGTTFQVFDCCSAGCCSLSEHNYPRKLPRTSEMALWNVIVGRICCMLAWSLHCWVMFRALTSITLYLLTWHQRGLVIVRLHKPDISSAVTSRLPDGRAFSNCVWVKIWRGSFVQGRLEGDLSPHSLRAASLIQSFCSLWHSTDQTCSLRHSGFWQSWFRQSALVSGPLWWLTLMMGCLMREKC